MAEYKDRMGMGDDQREPQTIAEAEQAFALPPPNAPADVERPVVDAQKESVGEDDRDWKRHPDAYPGRGQGRLDTRPSWMREDRPLSEYLWGYNCTRYSVASALARDLVSMGWGFPDAEPDVAVEVLLSVLVYRDMRHRHVAESVATMIQHGGFERRNNPPKPGDHYEVTGSQRDLARFLGEPYDGLNNQPEGPTLVAGRHLADGQDMLIYPGDFLLCTGEGVEVLGRDRRYPTGQVDHPDHDVAEPEGGGQTPAQSPLVGVMNLAGAFTPEMQEQIGRNVADALRPLLDAARKMRGEE